MICAKLKIKISVNFVTTVFIFLQMESNTDAFDFQELLTLLSLFVEADIVIYFVIIKGNLLK